MNRIWDLLHTKTTWLGLSYIVKTAYFLYNPGDRAAEPFIDSLFVGLAMIFVRDAILKTEQVGELAVSRIEDHEEMATARAAGRGDAEDPALVIDTEEPDHHGGPAQQIRQLQRSMRLLQTDLAAVRCELEDTSARTSSVLETVTITDTAVRTLQKEMRAVVPPFRAVGAAFHNIAQVLKAARLDRWEKHMSEQTQQLMDALAGNEPLFIELTTTIGNEAAQVTAEMEALRSQVAPSLQPAIESVLAHQQKVVQAIAAIRQIAPDVIPEPVPAPVPVPEPSPAPGPAPERGRRH